MTGSDSKIIANTIAGIGFVGVLVLFSGYRPHDKENLFGAIAIAFLMWVGVLVIRYYLLDALRRRIGETARGFEVKLSTTDPADPNVNNPRHDRE